MQRASGADDTVRGAVVRRLAVAAALEFAWLSFLVWMAVRGG